MLNVDYWKKIKSFTLITLVNTNKIIHVKVLRHKENFWIKMPSVRYDMSEQIEAKLLGKA